MAAEEVPVLDAQHGAAGDTLSDAELIAATRAGDAGSFAVLYTRHVDAARAVARRLVRSRAEADDLVAEGFAKVLAALRKGKGPDLAFRPYLLTSVRNALYDRTRRDSRIEFTDEPPESVNATLLSADYEREDRAMVAQAYAALPERWQMVLWHTDVEGRSPAEIAPLLGISANSVAALAYRAREGLREAYLQAHVSRGIGDEHRATADKLAAFVRDGLSARDRRAVEEHLSRCETCTALLAELQEANRSLKIVLIPALAGISAAAYLGGLPGGGLVTKVRQNPAPAAAGAVVAVAALVMGALAVRAAGDDGAAQALTAPPVGSGRPTTTTTTTTTTTLAPTTAATTAAPTTVPFTPPPFDTGVAPITVVPFNPGATTATTVRKTTTTTKKPPTTVKKTTTTTKAPTTTTTTTTAEPDPTTTTTTTTTTTVPVTEAPLPPPAVTATVDGVGPVYTGHTAYFRVQVANAASGNGGSARKVAVGPAEGVVVTFELPAGVSFLDSTAGDWQCEVTGSTVRCLLPRLESGVSASSIFSVDIPVGFAPAGGELIVSPLITVNGERQQANATSRTVTDGSDIADFLVAPGADLVVAGNTVLTCDPLDVSDNPNCDANKGGTKKFVNVLGAAKNSSSATIDLAGRPVQSAYLVWQGAGSPGLATVSLVGADGTTHAVTGALVREEAFVRSPAVELPAYVAATEVTDIVRAAGSGTYSVADIDSTTGNDDFAGWALVVVVTDDSAPLRVVTLQTPLQEIGPGSAVKFEGLPSAASTRNVSVALMAGDGDLGASGNETLSIADPNGQVPLLTEGVHPNDGNIWRSAILGSRNPSDVDTFGTDLDLFHAQVSGSVKTLSIESGSGSDIVYLSLVAVAYDI